MKTIKNIDSNKWKVVMILTVDNKIPVYYRLVNLATYEIENIPAYRILDEIINKHLDIVNVKCENNALTILNDDEYESMEDVILIDIMDEEVPNLFDWALSNDESGKILSRFDDTKNAFSPSNFRIDSSRKIAWTCKYGHTIHCGFPTFFGIKYKCPICKMKENDELPSLHYWAHITNNLDILDWYNSAEENLAYSTDIAWNEHKKVYFKKGNEVKKAFLNDITAKGKKVGFSDEDNNSSVNLSR